MKIGILTLPLNNNNYGCILQNFALQTILKRYGHEVWTINRINNEIPLYRKYGSILKSVIIGRKPIRGWLSKNENLIISQFTNQFIDRYIKLTEPVNNSKSLKQIQKKYSFNGFIVGSDQVWRPKYVPCITNYFLDFISHLTGIKRIAYAASFGVYDWEFSDEQTRQCKKLLEKFDAISVREDSAVVLCSEYFGRKPEQLLDPTLLLTKSDYINLINQFRTDKSDGDLFTYILDNSKRKEEIIKQLSLEYELQPFKISTNYSQSINNYTIKNLKDYAFPPVEQWLRSFSDAKFVITDSFHGTIFSLIFNKPVAVIINKDRGADRFNSLFSLLGINSEVGKYNNGSDIDYIIINDFAKYKEKIETMKILSFDFIQKYLNY
ncbi:MAG: polysaccharide pyruvyl transferase family protein [Proteiniphilum sp.]|uniref:polysaccharide pyruvyl transferase family protein n=1 Tax=Proteiniphilum sp. TaxID=1926877 RepID=UPI002ABB8F38|nr:polysaccharide pyruvyl transferase family protein [Proteiniphilum sp.]MDY9918631.1 polysaccharide pyruvyl transferase family protein [Proteiniphilum sp.]